MSKTTISKNSQGYGYKYTDLAEIHRYCEENNITYYQYVDVINDIDYIMTVLTKDGKELPARRGSRITDAVLSGIKNPAQEQGSAITYARRYSLLMALGLATDDDDAQSLSRPAKPQTSYKKPPKPTSDQIATIIDLYTAKGKTETEIQEILAKITTSIVANKVIEKLQNN